MRTFLRKFEEYSQNVSRWLGLLFVAGALGVFLVTNLIDLYHEPGRTYERISMPAELKLDYAHKTSTINNDGCPCFVTWNYRYSFAKGTDSPQALKLMKQTIKDAGYQVKTTTEKNAFDGFWFGLPKRGDSKEPPSVTVRTNERDRQPADPNHIYVMIDQMI